MTGPRKFPTIEEYKAQQEKRKAYLKAHNHEYYLKHKAKNKEKWDALAKKENTTYNKAHRVLHRALRSGEMQALPCEICGNPKADAHHYDYSKPLEVTWLCRKHHLEWHQKHKNL